MSAPVDPEKLLAKVRRLQGEILLLERGDVSSLSKSQLSQVSTDLRDLGREITSASQPITDENLNEEDPLERVKMEFKSMVTSVQILLRDLQHFRRSSVSLTVSIPTVGARPVRKRSASRPIEVLKKPQILQGTLKKQGEKSLIKTWKTRYFRQAGHRLLYFQTKDDLNQLGAIALNEITEVVRKDRLMFDLRSPSRTYHLQASDELQLEEWVINTNEWMEYFKLLEVQRAEIEKEFGRSTYGEQIMLIQTTLAQQEIQNDNLEQQIEEMEAHLRISLQLKKDTYAELETSLLAKNSALQHAIDAAMVELRLHEENMATESAKADEIRINLGDLEAEILADQMNVETLKTDIANLESQHRAQADSITEIEEAIITAKRGSSTNTARPLPQNLTNLQEAVRNAKIGNRNLQSENARLVLDMEASDQRLATLERQNAKKNEVLRSLCDQYQREYKELLAITIQGQGDDFEMYADFEALKERYFNALVIQLKLQYHIAGSQLAVDTVDLYGRFENKNYLKWPKLLEAYFTMEYSRT